MIHDLRRRTFSKHYLWVAILSVLGAASIKAKSIPSGDIWMGFGLMQAAGIAFAFGQVAYRDWKRANPQVPDRSVFALLSLGVFSVGCFSLMLTDFQAVELSTEHWKGDSLPRLCSLRTRVLSLEQGCIGKQSRNSSRI